ncbi:MAG: hypothetical protein KF729_24365 [Sandaracinaceae bacterium]|nr:hypothetical protein [Sandaracinaceae bacterium]
MDRSTRLVRVARVATEELAQLRQLRLQLRDPLELPQHAIELLLEPRDVRVADREIGAQGRQLLVADGENGVAGREIGAQGRQLRPQLVDLCDGIHALKKSQPKFVVDPGSVSDRLDPDFPGPEQLRRRRHDYPSPG